MFTYAFVVDGVVTEIIPPQFRQDDSPEGVSPSWIAGDYIPLDERVTPEFFSMCVDITNLEPQPQQQWTYDGKSFHPPVTPPIHDQNLAVDVRIERDRLLRSVYDPGILMAQRAVRMAASQEEIDYAESKIVELDSYAEALREIPQQDGFPRNVIWPAMPAK